MRNLKDIIIERLNITNNVISEKLLISRHKKKDIFSTIETLERCYDMFVVQTALILYEKRIGKSYDLTNIYNELPIYNLGTTDYEVQDITATDKDIWLGVINTKNGRPNEFEFASLNLLSTILGKGSTSKGCAVINYIVDDIEKILK
jgi:hypothetical protein